MAIMITNLSRASFRCRDVVSKHFPECTVMYNPIGPTYIRCRNCDTNFTLSDKVISLCDDNRVAEYVSSKIMEHRKTCRNKDQIVQEAVAKTALPASPKYSRRFDLE